MLYFMEYFAENTPVSKKYRVPRMIVQESIILCIECLERISDFFDMFEFTLYAVHLYGSSVVGD